MPRGIPPNRYRDQPQFRTAPSRRETHAMTPTTPIFYRCQSDGLEGPPIEIAWAIVASDESGSSMRPI